MFALLYALVGQRLVTTVGEPYTTAVLQLDRIDATYQLSKGIDERNLLSLQEGLTKAAELPKFNDTLFDEGKTLLRSLRMRLNALTAAVERGEPRPLADALSAAIEVSDADGRPFVDRYHLRSAAKKLQTLEEKAVSAGNSNSESGVQLSADLEQLYGRVKEAISLSRGRRVHLLCLVRMALCRVAPCSVLSHRLICQRVTRHSI